MPVGPLFAVFSFLAGGAATVGASNVFLFLGLSPHLVVFFLRCSAATERNAIDQNIFEIAHDGDRLVVEQTYAGERHGYAVLVASFYDVVVAY